MKIAIIGAGAMGSLFGAMLSPVSDVYLINHFKAHIQAIREKGLKIENSDGSVRTYSVFAATDPGEVDEEIDLAVIFTKSYSTKAAAISAKQLLGEKGLMITLQNGLGNPEIIADVVGMERTLTGVTSHGATLVCPGHIRHAGQGPTYIAGPSRHADFLKQIAETFTAGGIKVQVSENIETLIWGKLLVNVGINALAAILRVPNGVLGKTPACQKIMNSAVSEAEAVAHALNISLPYSNPPEQVRKVCADTAANRASMLQDILKRSCTEVAFINGAIVKKGNALGIPTPCNAFLCEIMEALEATSENRCT